ncbi:MAG: nucleotide exchange factor GrpE [Pseudomonadota bacterium]
MTDAKHAPDQEESQTPADAQSPEPQAAETAGAAGAVEGAPTDWAAKAQENWELYLRARAELDNFQKRSQRQLEDAHKYAVERFARELLPVKDSLEMALAVEAGGAEGVAQLRQGVEMTLNMLDQVFEKFGIQVLDPLEQRFDPNHHQAIAAVESEGEPNRVLQVHQKGYLLSDRLLRPALVSVSKAAGASA